QGLARAGPAENCGQGDERRHLGHVADRASDRTLSMIAPMVEPKASGRIERVARDDIVAFDCARPRLIARA
ncbi:MAG: hypothetical protein ACJ8EA_01650, partial [Xanthobacteraceae bacterium]